MQIGARERQTRCFLLQKNMRIRKLLKYLKPKIIKSFFMVFSVNFFLIRYIFCIYLYTYFHIYFRFLLNISISIHVLPSRCLSCFLGSPPPWDPPPPPWDPFPQKFLLFIQHQLLVIFLSLLPCANGKQIYFANQELFLSLTFILNFLHLHLFWER